MIQLTPQADLFQEQLRKSLVKETAHSQAITITKDSHIYNCGDIDGYIYFIEKGQVKLVMLSAEKRECIFATHAKGDVFGELCLSQLGIRKETAIAMEDTILKQIPSDKFLLRLQTDQLLEGFIQYLAVRLADQQRAIANLVTIDSEQHVGQTLLQLARTMGQKDPRDIAIKLHISYKELSNIVGTTQTRISLFIQRFRNLGLIDISPENFFIIKETKLVDYLTQIV